MGEGLVWVSPQRCWVRNGGGPAIKAALGMKLVLLLHLGLDKAASVAFEGQRAGSRFEIQV